MKRVTINIGLVATLMVASTTLGIESEINPGGGWWWTWFTISVLFGIATLTRLNRRR